MATTTVNTQSAGYQSTQTKLADVWTAMRPFVRTYVKKTETERRAWRARDPLLNKFVSICESVVNDEPDRVT